ncbi:MAG: alpha/beta hydrolase [Candidatus Nitrosocosmicus sp.]|nr:alpha/beta hydrolase [Candidatus Nitrosocosmicus sp.]
MNLRNKLILYPVMVIVMILFNVLSSSNLFSPLETNGSTKPNISNPFASTSSFQSKASILDNMPSHNVTVGDISIAYKQMGNPEGKPIILITGASSTMDMWNPLLLEALISANYKVIIFENRGVGESTAGTKEFSINQFANDTLNFLDALRINKTDVLGWSMGGFIAQQLALTDPDRVENLVLYATSCGGSNDRPTPPEILAIDKNISMSEQEKMQKLAPMFFAPVRWFEAHPDYTSYFPIPKEYPIPKQIHLKQLDASATWGGTCNTLSSFTQPTLIIVGTNDDPAPDSLTLAEGIPGSWLIRIGEAGHALMYQHPDEFNRLLITFLDIHKE